MDYKDDFLVGNLPPLRRGWDRGFWRLTEASVLPQGREERRQAPLGDLNDWRRECRRL